MSTIPSFNPHQVRRGRPNALKAVGYLTMAISASVTTIL
jgi:hypothetical protein